MSKARFRIHRSRAFSCPAFGAAVLCAIGAIAQDATRDCDDLPEADRQMCRMMRACAAIEDPERRRECFRAVAEAGPPASGDQALDDPVEEQPTAETVDVPAAGETADVPVAGAPRADRTGLPDHGKQATDPDPVQQPVPELTASTTAETAPAASAAVDERDGRRRSWGSRIRSLPLVGRLVPGGGDAKATKDAATSGGKADHRAVEEEDLETVAVAPTPPRSTDVESVIRTSRTYEVLDIPKRFTATVSAIHDPGRNRRLVALDDRLLFVSDRGGEGRLKIGDAVKVEKTSGVFGRKYRITGPSRRPFTALRIRCEHPDLNEANQQRCKLLSR